ncbi:uncharacterized protein LOC100678072 [Nasonia vitripennis]|uniref:Uncharacterized protein n=1 Tax=Nasonia vitripennis TaxID=7425 RepID=A0A7M7Q0E2_NASVI|nr:uncharacterized protein LOC100678072 [Nasonia vitripennis]
MDAPHVLVVEELMVDSLMFEFETDLMGSYLSSRNSSIDNDHGPAGKSREKVVDDLDDTVKMDLTPDDEPKTPEDDDQDEGDCFSPSMSKTTDEDQNIGLDAASEIFDKSALVDQPNGDLMLRREIELTEDVDESKTDEDYEEFDPIDYFNFKSGPTEKSNKVLMAEEELHEASVNFDLDLLPRPDQETAVQDVLNECTTEDNTTFGIVNSCNNKVDDDESDQEMRLLVEQQDNSQTSDLGTAGCKNDEECDSNHGIVCVKTSDYTDESDQEVEKNQSLVEQEAVQDNDQAEKIIEPVKASGKLEDNLTPPISPKLNQDNDVTNNGDPVDISRDDDDTYQQDEATKKEPNKKKLQVIPVKGKVYNTRRRKMRKIKVSPDLGSEISSTSSSSDEEDSSWSDTTTSMDSSEQTDCSSDSFSEEPFICTRYNLRNR